MLKQISNSIIRCSGWLPKWGHEVIGLKHRGMAQFLMISLMVLAAICICVYGVDRSIAIWMQAHIPHAAKQLFGTALMTRLTQLVYVLLLIGFVIYYGLRWYGVQHRAMHCFALVAISVVFAYFAKTNLQYFFGRYVPKYPNAHQLLFVRKPHLYGFHGWMVGSFPSGHMSVFTALLVSIMLFYRKLRYLVIILLCILGVLLVAFNYHFISDVIAGTYLGAVISFGLYAMKYRR